MKLLFAFALATVAITAFAVPRYKFTRYDGNIEYVSKNRDLVFRDGTIMLANGSTAQTTIYGTETYGMTSGVHRSTVFFEEANGSLTVASSRITGHSYTGTPVFIQDTTVWNSRNSTTFSFPTHGSLWAAQDRGTMAGNIFTGAPQGLDGTYGLWTNGVYRSFGRVIYAAPSYIASENFLFSPRMKAGYAVGALYRYTEGNHGIPYHSLQGQLLNGNTGQTVILQGGGFSALPDHNKFDVNSSGTVVGRFGGNSYIWNSSGAILQTLTNFLASTIDENGVVLGALGNSSETDKLAFRNPDGSVVLMDSLLDSQFGDLYRWASIVDRMSLIDDNGRFVVYNSTTPELSDHCWLFEPVPEPASTLPLLAGLFAIALRRRRS